MVLVLHFQADDVNVGYLETEAFKKEGGSLRGSIMIGPFFRSRKGYIPKPVVIKLEEEDYTL
jgi:UDP-N-acetylglucosamine 1-carboxyvinyltransferase